MEVRAERKEHKRARDSRRRFGIVLRVVLVLFAVCLLAGGMIWKFGQKTTLAAGYNMEKGSDGRYIFNVVEVVPQKNQAVLGNFIQGKENLAKDNSLAALFEVVKTKSWLYQTNCKNIFYWEGKTDPTGCEPFTVNLSNGVPVSVSNNEIFKLRMLGIEKDTGSKNPVINEERKKLLQTFDSKYVINYQVVTPKELETININNIQYLQIGAGVQLTNYEQLYNYVKGSATWAAKYTSTDDSDISWKTALGLYDRAMSADSKMSISISGYCMEATDRNLNVYKLYQMLNYFDDPSLFPNLYYDTSKGNPFGAYTTQDSYIDRANGQIHWKEDGGSFRIDESWNYLPNLAVRVDLSKHGVPYQSSIDKARNNNYIPSGRDNILLYQNTGGSGYFSEELSRESVNTILNFDPTPPSPPVEEKKPGVRVLEIQPCNRYWAPGNKAQLAKALGMEGKEDEIALTCVTPNQLNGMAVDLTAEFDLIIVGDNVDLLNPKSAAIFSFYSHIGELDGFFADAVIPDTLINGLMESDYTSAQEFNTLLQNAKEGPQLQTNGHLPIRFLKNIAITLELGKKVGGKYEPLDLVSKARFSGNDVNKYMQKQIAEFVNSGQPVIVAESIIGENATELGGVIEKQVISFNGNDRKNTPPEKEPTYSENARLFFALLGIEDESQYYADKDGGEILHKKPLACQTTLETVKSWTKTTPAVTLLNTHKPSVTITDTAAEGEQPKIVEQYSETLDLNALSKSNTLSFKYDITLTGNIADYRMKVVIDRNGDGIFDLEGEGKTSGKDGTKGKQNNATDSIKNDKVYEVKPVDWINNNIIGEGFTIRENDAKGGTASGIFEAQLSELGDLKEPIEEFYEFRVIMEPVSPDNKLRGVWTGYMRPDIESKTKRILQITPYVDSPLLSDPTGKFQEVFAELTESGENPEGGDTGKKPDYELTFENINESQFASQYGTDVGIQALLENYDLIIVGTDFTSASGKPKIDLIEEKASDVLNQWMTKYQMPIIYTNDFASHVNAENYVTPKKETGSYKAVMRPALVLNDGRKIVSYSIGQDDDKTSPIVTIPLKVWNDWNSSGNQITIQVPPSQFGEVLFDARNKHEATNPLKSVVTNDDANNYSVPIGFLTEAEANSLYVNESQYWLQKFQAKIIGNPGQDKFTAYYKDIHSCLNQYETIPEAWVDKNNPVTIAGDSYYRFKYPDNGQQYLAVKSDNSVNYILRDVAGTSDALYPDKGVWNYRATQSLRYALGMDRFAVTQTGMKPADKRDTGTCRRYQKVEELQGFTNGALLEHAYPLDPKYERGLFSTFFFVDEKENSLPLGSKPRTNAIEKLNDGAIGHYPFEIAGDINNSSETKISIQTNHPPLYELDLMREVGEGKIDDVTVWYTFSGAKTGSTPQETNASKYFDLTAKDAGNNYYLYSKGKTYYTGFSLYEEKEGETSPEIDEQDMEMKLFINTIYAALNSTLKTNSITYEAVVNPIGTVSNISRSTAPGTNNQYIYYFDEYNFDDTNGKLELLFRIQKPDASEGEKTPIWLGIRENEDGIVKYKSLLPEGYNLPEGIAAFPVEKSPPEVPGETETGQWYRLSIIIGEKGLSKDSLDGTTLMIGAAKQGSVSELNPDAIHAEIRMVKRDTFNLD